MRVYTGASAVDTPVTTFAESGIHIDELALMFAYFAMAALMDVELTPFNYEAEAYACLSRGALSSSNILSNATIPTIETLVGIQKYNFKCWLTVGHRYCLAILRYVDGLKLVLKW